MFKKEFQHITHIKLTDIVYNLFSYLLFKIQCVTYTYSTYQFELATFQLQSGHEASSYHIGQWKKTILLYNNLQVIKNNLLYFI